MVVEGMIHFLRPTIRFLQSIGGQTCHNVCRILRSILFVRTGFKPWDSRWCVFLVTTRPLLFGTLNRLRKVWLSDVKQAFNFFQLFKKHNYNSAELKVSTNISAHTMICLVDVLMFLIGSFWVRLSLSLEQLYHGPCFLYFWLTIDSWSIFM